MTSTQIMSIWLEYKLTLEKKIEKLRYSWSSQARYLIQHCTIETQDANARGERMRMQY